MVKRLLLSALLLLFASCGCNASVVVHRGLKNNAKGGVVVVSKKGQMGMKTKPPTTSPIPTFSPTLTLLPTVSPTLLPTVTPLPTSSPSDEPTKKPSPPPTRRIPTSPPTKKPTRKPTTKPTKRPTTSPTFSPTITFLPTLSPTTTFLPTFSPTITLLPTTSPTSFPTTANKKGKKNKKRLKRGQRLFTSGSPTEAPTTAGPSSIPPKRGRKGKRPQISENRALLKAKGVTTTTRRRHHKKSDAAVEAARTAPGKKSDPAPKGVQAAQSSQQGIQSRVDNPVSAAESTKAPAASKASKKSGGPKGANKSSSSSSPVGVISTIAYRAPGKKGPENVIPYDPLGKKGAKKGVDGSSDTPTTTSTVPPSTPTTITSVSSPPPPAPQNIAGSTPPTARATSGGSNAQIFATVQIPKFAFNYTVSSTSVKPTQQNYNDLSVITAVLLDSVFFDFYQYSNNSRYYATDIASFLPTSSFRVEFSGSSHFLLPTLTPTAGQLAYVLTEKFDPKVYLALLTRLESTNVFSTTTGVTIEIDPDLIEPIQPTSTDEKPEKTVPTGSKVNAKVVAPIAAGALVAILVVAALCIGSRRRSNTDEESQGKKPPGTSNEDGTVDMDGSCYNSVVSRANRANNGSSATSTAEFGGTGRDNDDCVTLASGSYSMSPLPTIGENDDEVDSVDQHRPMDQPRTVSSPCTTEEMSLSDIPLYEDSDDEL